VNNSPTSSTPPPTCGSTPPFTSPPPPACDAANSPGLRWADWPPATHRLSIARSRQSVGGRAVEIPTKTAASRRCIDLDPATEQILNVWRQRQRRAPGRDR
jgi:hypothetical protein